MTRRGYLLLAVLGAVVVPLALAVRWGGNAELKGSRFHPWPDTVEYAAEAQALAQTGTVFLQVGPHRVRPRYPPGWPLLIAAALRMGVQARDLWRITAPFGAALAWLLAVMAAAVTRALGPHHPGPLLPASPPSAGRRGSGWLEGFAPLLAGLLAGCLWAVAPVAVDLGQTLMSDEPTALVSLAGLLLTGIALLSREDRGAWGIALGGGIAFGLAAAMRSIVAVLMLLPLAVLLAGGFRRSGLRALLPRALAWALGAAVFPALVMLIQARSGWPLWQWSGYGFWMPGRFDHWTSTFNLHYAFQPDQTFPQGVNGRPVSHLELAVRVLLGLPGLAMHHDLGFFWPLAGWLSAIPLYRMARRRSPEVAPWIAAALLLWTLAHVAVFSLYFYPSSRFYLGPLALCPVLLAAACGVGLSRPDRRARLLAGAAVAGVALLAAAGFAGLRREPLPDVETERTRAQFNRWLRWKEERRARSVIPFDPVQAQALGLLTPEVVSQVHAWGELPDTVHVRRLRANGTVPREGGPAPVR
jgi:hypothetical protein